MTSSWTREAVEALAPDAGSLKSAVGLAKVREWARLEHADQVVWGEIQGSGSKPYQSRIDLAEPVFKCSCPSRKFPCKHGLALMMMWVDDQAAFTRASPPDWVAEWLTGRLQRAEKKVAKAETAPAVDPLAQAKRTESRESKIEQGLNELDLWMHDLLRIGLSKARQQADFAANMAARLVDAQASGLAREVDQLASTCASGEGWEQRAFDAIGRIALIAHAYREQDRLIPALREEVRASVGWTIPQEDVLRSAPVMDTWHVLGHMVEDEARLTTRRTWLYGARNQRFALVLGFAAGNQALTPAMTSGHCFEGELHFFPGASGVRALVAAQGKMQPFASYPLTETIDAALDRYAQLLAIVPWTARTLFCLQAIVVQPSAQGPGEIVNRDGACLPLDRQFAHMWDWLAVSRGVPSDVVGEWDGYVFTPLALLADGRAYDFARSASPQLIPMTAHA
jgi:hypothetical protein